MWTLKPARNRQCKINNVDTYENVPPQKRFKDNSIYVPLVLALNISPLFLLSDASTSYKNKISFPCIFAVCDI